MKKIILSSILSLAFLCSLSLSAQDTTTKKECCKAKTECKKDCEKKDCKKKCNKNKDKGASTVTKSKDKK